MIRTAVLALALIFVLGSGAVASDSANWLTEAGADVVKKAVDIVVHNDGGDDMVYAITHDDKIYRRNSGTKTWALNATLTSAINPPDNGAGYALVSGASRSATWPQLVSFKGGLYTARWCLIMRDSNGNVGAVARLDVTDEWSVFNILSPNLPVLQIRGPTGLDPRAKTLVGGYLFKTGGSLYFGGGGGSQITPQAPAAAPTAGTNDCRYVYSTADGITWTLFNNPAGRTLGNDEYGRPIPAAMPNGYRYSHLVSFNSALWDYYGCYDPGTLAFTPKTDDIHTEPWGWFLMGTYTKQGTTQAAPSTIAQDRLVRVGFPRNGNQNFLAEICRTDDTWRRINGEALITETSNAATWTLAQGASVIVDDSLQVFAKEAGVDIELRRGVDYTCTPAGVVTVTAPPAGNFTATYLYRKTAADAPNDGTVYWRACAGVANPAIVVAAEIVGAGDDTKRQFQVAKHAHVIVTKVQFDGADPPAACLPWYATPSGRIVFPTAPAASVAAITADYSYMSAHDGLYATYSKATLTAPGPPPTYAFESGVYKYNDENYDWLWSFKLCTVSADARAFTGGIFAKPGDGVYVGTNAGVVRRGIAAPPTDPDPVP